MAIEKTIVINADTSDALKDVDKLKDSVTDLDKKADEVGQKGLSGLGKAAGVAKKGVKSLAGGFKLLGGAIKAAGIGLLITAFLSLKEVLTENEKTAKFFKVAFEGVSIVMNDLINFVADNFIPTFQKVKKFFDELTFDNIKKAIQENLIERIESAVEVFGFLGDAVKKFFSGDFSGALDSAKEAGNEFVDVMTGVDGTLGKVSDTVSNVVDSVTEYAKETIKAAESNIRLADAAEIAAAQQGLLVEKYDQQAEKLRQVRDNDLIGIAERQKANDELLQVLAKQEEAMLREADAILASAQAQANKNNSTENQVALLEAQANKEGVLAQITGFRSEQEANRVALLKEQKDLTNSITEADANRANAQREFLAEQEETEAARLEKQREALEQERIDEAERLQRKIDSYALDTQARVDAEIELKDRLQEIDNEIVVNKKASDNEIAKSEKELAEKKQAAQEAGLNGLKSTLSQAASLLGEQTAAGKAAAVAAATIETYQSAVSSYNSLSGIPIVGPALGAVAAGVAVASGIANVKSILSVKTPKGGGGGSVPSAPSQPQAPAFNLVGQSGVNQVQDSLQEESTPIQAYVVGSEVTSQQELDRNQQNSASI